MFGLKCTVFNSKIRNNWFDDGCNSSYFSRECWINQGGGKPISILTAMVINKMDASLKHCDMAFGLTSIGWCPWWKVALKRFATCHLKFRSVYFHVSHRLIGCDFKWIYFKMKVFVHKPNWTAELKNEIWRVISQIDPMICKDVIETFVKRTKFCCLGMGAGGLTSFFMFNGIKFNI